MPISTKLIENTTSRYQKVTKFVYAYPDRNLITPLGWGYKFKGCLLPVKYDLYKDEIENFEVRTNDVYVTSFMKTGSNWCQEMIWLLNNNLNYEIASQCLLTERFPTLEFDIFYEGVQKNQLEYLRSIHPIRHIKSHLPAGLLPKQLWTVKPKIIYVSRGLKDVAISMYHHAVNFVEYKLSKNDFLEAFLNNAVFLSPYHDHLKYFWLMRAEENILHVRYEDLKSDLMGVIKKVSSFLGKSYSNDDLLKLKEHLSIDSLRNNPSFNFARTPEAVVSKNVTGAKGFIRKGIVGAYKEEMSIDMIEKFDAWTLDYNQKNGTNIEL